ncbi:putative E3 ubiquitin-protein ligase [Halotydeus destructor]|nr:putative E3 ubiquitin-protein ligase [Halotydeus destructor]KAI1286023.1 putative E3 ubiquitin-protein ligase [Halotydeus destructor]
MASYFDEHDCIPLASGATPNHELHLARLLLDMGVTDDFQEQFSGMFANGDKKPPAAEEVIKNLPDAKELRSEDEKCPLCLDQMNIFEDKSLVTEKNLVKQLPCKHQFHGYCITPWLKMVNTCPLCKQELPTDDPLYEEVKKLDEAKKKREKNWKNVQNSMYC